MADRIITTNWSWTGDNILSGNIYRENSILGGELTIDTFTLQIYVGAQLNDDSPNGTGSTAAFYTSDDEAFYVSDGAEFHVLDGTETDVLTNTAYGDTVTWYRNDVVFGKFYVSSVQRIGQYLYEISCVSAVGLLDNINHKGGLYDGSTTVAALLADIIGNTFPYSIDADADIANTAVYGYLPYDTARNNLQQVMFAYGLSLQKDTSGDVVFTVLNATAGNIEAERVYDSGTVEIITPATEVQVTEHAYFQDGASETYTLFDNTGGSAASNLLVTFSNGPYFNVSASGLTISEQGVNYAVVSGTGALTGQRYTHQTHVATLTTGAGGNENVVSVDSATLISSINAADVLERLASYYQASQIVSEGFVIDETAPENPGGYFGLANPFGDTVAGYLQSASVDMSATLKADATFVVGYTPPTGYANVSVIDTPSTWTVPTGVSRIRAVLIGGGYAGADGSDGNPGGAGANYMPGANGLGGAGGIGGDGGKIRIVSLSVSPGDAIPVIIGAENGGDTTITHDGTTYTSADGISVTDGFTDVINHITYGVRGTDGLDGGSTVEYQGTTYTRGASGGSVTKYWGGISFTAQGGNGGGAAAGANGGSGYDGVVTSDTSTIVVTGGKGGKGADATPPEAQTVRGGGGNGGHGGGGGGGGGAYVMTGPSQGEQLTNGAGGDAGQGSNGTSGIMGIALLYY